MEVTESMTGAFHVHGGWRPEATDGQQQQREAPRESETVWKVYWTGA